MVVQNYSLVHVPDLVKERPLAVCISSTFLYLDDIRHMASEIKAQDPSVPVVVGGILAKKVMDGGDRLAPQTLRWLDGTKDSRAFPIWASLTRRERYSLPGDRKRIFKSMTRPLSGTGYRGSICAIPFR